MSLVNQDVLLHEYSFRHSEDSSTKSKKLMSSEIGIVFIKARSFSEETFKTFCIMHKHLQD